MSDESRHYPAGELKMSQAVPGAMFWGVQLEKVMLTYFELQPRAVFARHHHEAEQITLVLSGRLVFEAGEREYTLGPGDVVTIPSNVPHGARALDEPVRAVDAWSPPRESYG